MILDRETYFSHNPPKRFFLFLKKFSYILFRFLGRPNWGRLEAGKKVGTERVDLSLLTKENGDFLCTSCQLCSEICPTQCLEVSLPAKKTFPHAPLAFKFDITKCIFCDLCVSICPEDAIEFSPEGRSDFLERELDLVKIRAKDLS